MREAPGRLVSASATRGWGEYSAAIRSGGTLLGSINAGFFQTAPRLTEARIRRTCRRCSPLNADEALHLYRTSIQNPVVEAEDILPGLELLAEYLGQTYRMLQPTHYSSPTPPAATTTPARTISSPTPLSTSASTRAAISPSPIGRFLPLQRVLSQPHFQKRTGVNINVYINKVRMELAKNHLLLSPGEYRRDRRRRGLQRSQLLLPGFHPDYRHPAHGVPPPLPAGHPLRGRQKDPGPKGESAAARYNCAGRLRLYASRDFLPTIGFLFLSVQYIMMASCSVIPQSG